jgi:hypothetical protein
LSLALMALIVTVPVPLLVTVTVFGALVAPIPVAEKVSVAGLKLSETVGPPVAVPVIPTTCGLNALFVAISNAPLIDPLYSGVKVTTIVQLAAPASEAPHVPPVTE